MKNISKKNRYTIFRSGILVLMTISFTNDIWSQNSIEANLKYQQDTIVKSQAQKDWDNLKYSAKVLTPNEEEKLDNANILEYVILLDSIKQNRSRLAKVFLDKYPDDPHYEEALAFFFSPQFRPTFIDKKIDEDQYRFLSKFYFRKSSLKENLTLRRALPIDKIAKEQWLNYGNELVEKTLASDKSSDRKVLISMGLISRDYLLASQTYAYLQREIIEADYWEYFDTYYWASFKQRLYNLMETFPDSKRLATYIPSLLNDLKRSSPKLANRYLREFYKKIGNDENPLSGRAGIKALYKTLGDNLEALKDVDEADANKPIEMSFTAMDGKKIDLSKMRGKVVLIDFWNIGCSPCIKEMPHVQALYDKYRDKGFEVIGIAGNGDEAKQSVLKIMKKTGAKWPQRLDKGEEATVNFISLYNINSFPTVWLLDKKGKIVHRNARGKRLEPLIRKHLGLDNEKSKNP